MKAIKLILFISIILLVESASQAQGSDKSLQMLFKKSQQVLGDTRVFGIAIADVDIDGDNDIFLTNYIGSSKLWLNDGKGNFTESNQNFGNSEAHAVAMIDFNADGFPDIFLLNHAAPCKIFFNDGKGTFNDSGQNIGSLEEFPGMITCGDVDNDGDLDAFISYYQLPNRLWLNNGKGFFSVTNTKYGGEKGHSMALADVNGDSYLDLYLCISDQPDEIWLNDGKGIFTDSGQRLGNVTGYESVDAGDINGDKYVDFITGNSVDGIKIWLNQNGTGKFIEAGPYFETGSGICKLLDADLDGDLDLFIAGKAGTKLLINSGKGIYTPGQVFDETWVSRVAFGKLDSDNDFDLVLGKREGTGGNAIYFNECNNNLTKPSSLKGYSNEKQEFKLRFTFTNEISKVPISGRIILGFNKDISKPISTNSEENLFDPQPTFAWDVNNWKPGESIVLDSKSATSRMGTLDSLNGWYGAQAFIKINKKARVVQAKGNASTIKSIVFIEKGKMCRPIDMIFNNLMGSSKKFAEDNFIKEVKIKSDLLAKFYGEEDSLKAAVILPNSYYTDSMRYYPTVYVFGGWGSSHYDAHAKARQLRYGVNGFGNEKIFVFVNHECHSGYHVFCSSETNGPREEAFLKEFIPYIEGKFKVNRNPQTRFLMGQSSGAWASLWLLINYPDQFGGAYAGSPDPVDFTDFTGTNIYEKNANMYYNSKGEKKYLFDKISMEDLAGLDRIAGWGEQMYSFDATFSRKDDKGEPHHLFNWDTGLINPEVANYWEKHDLSKVISKFDRSKIKQLQGKIHIYVAEDDFFGLNRPVHAFQKVLKIKGIDSDIRFPSSGGHDVWTDDLRKTIHSDIDQKVISHLNKGISEKNK